MWLEFSPQAGHEQAGHEQAGHEQAGHRPALVLSPSAYNRRRGLALCCPVTTQVKGHPFEVVLPAGLAVRGAVLADQGKRLDWRARRLQAAGRAPAATVADVLAKLRTLL